MKLKAKINGLLMKNKKWILVFLSIFIVATAGIGVYFAVEKMGEMTKEEAEAIVRNDHNGEVLSFAREWEWEFGTPSTIKMAIKTENSYEEIEIDASSGQILSREANHLLSSSPVAGEPSASTAPAIMPEEAIERALDEVTGNVKEMELDEEDHNLIYELEIEEGSKEYNVHVDAITGSILMVSTES
jgi:uncharacterized membrane protein YkoI